MHFTLHFVDNHSVCVSDSEKEEEEEEKEAAIWRRRRRRRRLQTMGSALFCLLPLIIINISFDLIMLMQ